ncbi:PAS sensor-containing signal transduction protein [Aliarcobacter faecis]|uniref:PAS domain S-box protein n=1 Tax=Aliarcobacter faecis TaxID=1564138 RepID=UPI00047941B9|nr:PAS domain S-box protein [Aliarcobacter faecis]QKF73617.1 PAS sensor-containing signal transduction protein [Aliarcobacter faecis]
MSYKSPKFIFLFIFIILSFGLFFIFDFYKEKEIKLSLENNKKEILHKYSEIFRNYFEFGELIYFNEFIKDKKILNILKNSSLNQKKYIYESSVDSFAFYSNLGLSNFSFYNSNKDLILSFNEKSSIKKENLSKNDDFCFVKNDEKLYLAFLKPIFDEKLNFLGILSLEFLFDDFIQKLQKELNLTISYEISKILEEKVKKDKIYINIFTLKDKSNLFLLVQNNNSGIEAINKLFLEIFCLAILFLSILIFAIFKIFDYKTKMYIEKKDNEEFFTHIDKHILRLDTDINGNIVYISKAFCKISGYTEEEIIGKNVSILRHPDMSNTFYRNLWSELRETNFWQGEVKNKDKFGNTYWIKSVIFPKYNLKNELIGFRSIRFDITSIKQLEKINRLLKEDLSNKLNELKLKEKTDIDVIKIDLMSKIVDSMSHLWKEPISKISLELQKIDNQEIKDFVSKELFSLSNMLNDFKSIFKHTAEKTNLLTVLDSVKKSFTDEIDGKILNIKIDKNLDINLNIPKNELKNILINILKTQLECLKLSSFFDVNIFISVLSESSDNEIIIKIEDNIKKDKVNSSFEELLNSKDDKFFDTSIHLAKLLIEKNSGLFWYKNSISNTIYYIKLRKDLI